MRLFDRAVRGGGSARRLTGGAGMAPVAALLAAMGTAVAAPSSPPVSGDNAGGPVSILPQSFVAPPLVPNAGNGGQAREAPAAALEDLANLLERNPDAVAAEVDGTPITMGMVAESVRDLPPMWGATPSRQIFDVVLNTLMQKRLLAIKARKLGLEKDKVVQDRIANATDRELAAVLLRNETQAKVTDKAVEQRYVQEYAGKPGPDEAWLRVIGADSKNAAQEALQRLNSGTDFPTVVQQYSHDPSRDAGGDLGYVTPDVLPPELRAVAFALPVGEISAFPIQSNGLWYIIEVEGRRQRAAPPLQDVKQRLKEQLGFEAGRDFIEQARRSADIRVYGPVGLTGDEAKAATKP
ncbi:peptidylprolyl isomerase [Rhodopila sp.]|uniref:peptidylprolyl isomerase n=1 Tax=Rhodopila sp. TaxID=2480087 RepID=UPI002C75114C|nr:peptidylprolyl isomerase [Rhodopila sp.]HVZ06404.1 peptidylprolyl isomerase [Rhodopila sp.]